MFGNGTDFENGPDFENEVRRIARALWQSHLSDGAIMEDGRERDGVFITEEMVHILECTTSRKKDKAEEDIKKLLSLAKTYKSKYPMKGIKCWFVTLEEPTADQRSTVEPKDRDNVVIISCQAFKSQLIEANSYLDDRYKYRFGSMRNMFEDVNVGNESKRDFKFVELDIIDNNGIIWGVNHISKGIETGKRLVMLGDYGAGKSTTMREVYINLLKAFRKNQTFKFPILLNLRDHHGQTNPAEALERHARNIGFKSPHHLVRAWRSGYGILMLDGFDEIATAGWAGKTKKLKDIRYRSMELIRELIKQTPPESGMLISGRSHFFDSIMELKSTLGVKNNFSILNLNDFTDTQIKEYLGKHAWENTTIPAWLPSRPLLLGYLLSRQLLNSLSDFSSPAMGWDELLQRISSREAEIEAGIDGETVRTILERLGTKSRNTNDGLGRLQQNDIVDAFQQSCGYSPDDRGLVLLQRLPGLGWTTQQNNDDDNILGFGAQRQDDGSRQFIDKDLADALKAGDIFRYIQDPYNFNIENPEDWRIPLGQLGQEMVALFCQRAKNKQAQLSTAIHHALIQNNFNILGSDLVQVLQEIHMNYSAGNVTISDIHLEDLSYGEDSPDNSNITYNECIIQRLEISPSIDMDKIPAFKECYIISICGLVSKSDLPENKFGDKNTIDDFADNTLTTNAILNIAQPLGVKVLLTILKKLYLQSGSGRQNSALIRGLDQRGRALVPDIIQLLKSEGLVTKVPVNDDVIWLPIRSASLRVKQIIAAPTISTDPLIAKASRLS